MADIIERLRRGATNGVLIPCEDLVEAAEIIEQYRADHESDKQTNSEQRIELNECRAALGMRNSDVQALEIALKEITLGRSDLARGIAAEALRSLVGDVRD